MREQPNISAERLNACLQDQYGVAAVTLDFLPLGLDTRAGVYRAVGADGANYLLKAKTGPRYEPTYRAPRYLRDHGVMATVAPLPTQSGAVWAEVEEWTISLYPFIAGECGWDPDMTDAHWQALGEAVRQMHAVPTANAEIGPIRRETFDPAGYRRAIEALEADHISAAGGDHCAQTLRAEWQTRRTLIYDGLGALETLATQLRAQAGPGVICHADLHQSNIIRAPAGGVHIIDWDDVMLAPKERDFLFVGDPADPATPFFKGYGPTRIDWPALAYYKWERVIQDEIEFARTVLTLPDIGEADRAEAVRFFRMNLEPEGDAMVAQAIVVWLADDRNPQR